MVFVAYLILDAGQDAEFAFHRNVKLVGVVNHLLGEGHVLLEGERRAVDHHRREAVVDTVLAELESIAVVEVQADLGMFPAQGFGIFHRALCHIAEQYGVGVVTRALRHLEDDGALGIGGCLDNGLQLLHIVKVERGDGVTAMYCLGEHFTCVYQA